MAMVATGLGSTAVAHAAGPSITVTPRSGLVSGQTVTVVGSGFFADEELIALQCPRGVTDLFACDFGGLDFVVTNGRGNFSTTMTMHRTILSLTGFTDCAPAACEIAFADAFDFNNNATAPVRFDAVPLPTTSVTVTPATGLGDRQTVTISGTGFTAHRDVLAMECVTGTFSCIFGFFARATVKGRFSLIGSVHRNLSDFDGNPVDCAAATGTCEMVAYDPLNADYHSSTPLDFDASLPPPPSPTLKVVPTDNLPYYARVSVHGRHWSAGELVLLMECPNASEAFFCFDIVGIGQVGADGTISADPMLHRKVADVFSGRSIDCAKRNHCVVVAQSFTDELTAIVPVTFDPAAPIPPRPRVNLVPAAPYADGQIVTVNGRNFAPNARFDTTECFESTSFYGCFLPRPVEQFTDANGAFSTPVKLHRFVKLPGETIDCADASVQCTLSSQSEGGAYVETPLVFSATAAAGAETDASPMTFSARPGGRAAVSPACAGMRLSPHVSRLLAGHPREAATVCARLGQAIRG